MKRFLFKNYYSRFEMLGLGIGISLIWNKLPFDGFLVVLLSELITLIIFIINKGDVV